MSTLRGQVEHEDCLASGVLSEPAVGESGLLERNGYRVIPALGSSDARSLGVLALPIGVVVIGHGSPWLERDGLVAHFGEVLSGVPIVALLRSSDDPFTEADLNCRADNPPLWERTVAQALGRSDRLH